MKSMAQMYHESFDLTSKAPRVRYETLRPQAELHLRFWLPIAEMLSPRGLKYIGSAGARFYDSCSALTQFHEIVESIQRMKALLGLPQLGQGTWRKLRPIFRELLRDSLHHNGMDQVACMVRQMVRLDFGLQPEADYKGITVDCVDYHGTVNEYWAVEDEPWHDPAERYADFVADADRCDMVQFKELDNRYNDVAAFERSFPGMSHRRTMAATAIEPILSKRHDWGNETLLAADRYMTSLLAMTFEETRLKEPIPSRTPAAA